MERIGLASQKISGIGMEYSIQNHNNGIEITLEGHLTFSDNQKFKQIIDYTLESDPVHINLDFRQVEFIDSAGLGMLLLLRDACQNKHIPVTIHSPRGQVERILMISKFDQLFNITP